MQGDSSMARSNSWKRRARLDPLSFLENTYLRPSSNSKKDDDSVLVVDQRTDAALAVGRATRRRKRKKERERERERRGIENARARGRDVMANGRNYTLHFKREYPGNGWSYRYETKSVFKRGIFAGSPRPRTHTHR